MVITGMGEFQIWIMSWWCSGCDWVWTVWWRMCVSVKGVDRDSVWICRLMGNGDGVNTVGVVVGIQSSVRTELLDSAMELELSHNWYWCCCGDVLVYLSCSDECASGCWIGEDEFGGEVLWLWNTISRKWVSLEFVWQKWLESKMTWLVF